MNLLLDASDCAESPLLGESKHRRRWVRRSWSDSYLVPYARSHSRSHPRIEKLTEAYFKGTSETELFRTRMELLLEQFNAFEDA